MADLVVYKSRRDFKETPEPEPSGLPKGAELAFVVHKHAARNLHYDLRLEMEGVLKSWACPKGPSLDPAVKRLAVRVEDHPLEYRDFEGVIPEGNYGAGGVIIWDRGTYRHPEGRDRAESERLLAEGLRKGDLKFTLKGEKLRGEFALVRTRRNEKSWLLLKKKDRQARGGEGILAENRSVASGRTLEGLVASEASTATERKKADRIRLREAEEEGLGDAPRGPMPHLVRPMLATPTEKPFDDPEWIFEMKWDGYRALAEIRQSAVSLYSRNLLPLNEKFPPIVDALRHCRFEAVVDGEIVAVDDRGRPDFQALQNYPRPGGDHLLYYVFDLLHFNGRDLTALPLLRRKELLQKILPSSPRVRLSDHVRRDGILFFRVVKERGLEGIVAKDARSPYLPGKRSRQWLKVKTTLTQKGVIGGFTASRSEGRPFGSLVLGVYEGDELVCIGHSGGGFSAEDLRGIHGRLRRLIRKRCPFKVEPPTRTPATWVRPELVCEVAFSEWTDEGLMRHPVFLRLREDKEPREVVRESGAGR